MANMTTSQHGLIHLIKVEGGAQLSLYDDLGKGKGHCTIGVGHLVHKGVCNGRIASERPFLKGIDPTEAKKLLRQDLIRIEAAVNGGITVALTQNQFDALVSFTFNVGATAFRHSTLRKLINSKQFGLASDEFLKWDKMTINGKKITIDGLTNRRIAEKALFDGAMP